ncbi:MAG: arylformamidase [Burkholderiales bacterium]|nr:arylformamidase [Burkholderiales bacterium]
MMERKIWDISPPVGPDTPTFPGDEPYRLHWTARLGPGCPVNLSSVTASPHVGAHADAPLHYANGAPSIAEVDLAPYLGPCRVIHAFDVALVQPEHVQPFLTDLPARVLLRTCRVADRVWRDDFPAFSPATLGLLADHGVRLVGIDTQSVDPASSKTLEAHQILLQRSLRVLENLVLDGVPAGDYELIALPLRWVGACASPVRAILRSL